MNDVPTSTCITPSSMVGSDDGGSGCFSGVEKVKAVCCRGGDTIRDDEKTSGASLIGKC